MKKNVPFKGGKHKNNNNHVIKCCKIFAVYTIPKNVWQYAWVRKSNWPFLIFESNPLHSIALSGNELLSTLPSAGKEKKQQNKKSGIMVSTFCPFEGQQVFTQQKCHYQSRISQGAWVPFHLWFICFGNFRQQPDIYRRFGLLCVYPSPSGVRWLQGFLSQLQMSFLEADRGGGAGKWRRWKASYADKNLHLNWKNSIWMVWMGKMTIPRREVGCWVLK